MGSVRVAVRIRPFNQREKDMNSKCCLEMNGVTTTIYSPEDGKDKQFAFDFSYWSHNGFKEDENGVSVPDGPNSKYASQKQVFEDLGLDVLKSAVDGYNSTLFAYGQTGAGKSYSMVGYGANRGIIPMVCEELFHIVDRGRADPSQNYQVTVTMLEIYNEQIRDLLNPASNVPGGLKVRSKPGIGVYVEGLTPVPVLNYEEIARKMDEGTQNRTVASTKMNNTSSRAHTVFGIIFTSIKTSDGIASETTARINLVDLAGSERAESTGATGDRLKEGCAINASLSALGNVISALAENAGGKKIFVPYRNSALTRLLQDALGGNSRTVMIAALSPADVNYDETLGTLRYADRAKKIKNKVVKMENPTDAIIRQLKEENARLMAMLEGKGIPRSPAPGAEDDETPSADQVDYKTKLEQQMAENERMLQEMAKSWEQKLAEAKQLEARNAQANDTGAIRVADVALLNVPHIINLHEDPMLAEMVVYPFKAGETRIGRKTQEPEQKNDIILSGLNIIKHHALVVNDGSSVTLTALNSSKTFVNGELLASDTPRALNHCDRVLLGNNYLFRYQDPNAPEELKGKEKEKDYTFAMEEYQEKQGLGMSSSLSEENKKLEREEAQKRQELEGKLKEMEDAMRREREQAAKALDLQRKMLVGSTNMTPAERAKLEAEMALYEAEFKRKEQSMEDQLAQRKAMSTQILQEQMKRKRQSKKIEEQLAKLMPLVNEANAMAEAMEKPVRFEARLAVRSNKASLSSLDELKNLKTIEVTIRVSSTTNSNVWTWNDLKFDTRLILMREMYQEFSDFGPRDVPKSKDPFWDPPEAIEIGKAYVYLKALSQLVEIESEFSIVDYKGDDQGKLCVEIMPEMQNGQEVSYLDSPEELLNQSINLRVKVPYASALPDKLANDVYVSFAVYEQERETQPCEGKTTNPKFKFLSDGRLSDDTVLSFPPVDQAFLDYLLKDVAVFEVRGFSDPKAEQMKGLTGGPASAAGSAEGKCMQCEESAAAVQCRDCSDKRFCQPCFALLHKSAKKAGHTTIALGAASASSSSSSSSSASPAAAAASMCVQCEEQPCVVRCVECAKSLCGGCNELLHKAPKKKTHVREPIGTAASASAEPAANAAESKCVQCEENAAIVKCVDCNKIFCEGCNNLLHKAPKKAVHVREKL